MLLKLFITFFQVGLFTIGGGLVAIPIMQDYVLAYQWVSEQTFVDMIAVSQSTPGPIGINMATYVGQTQIGLLGSIVATLGMVLPSFIIVVIISHFLKAFKENKWVQAIMESIKPAAIGAILAAAFQIATISLFLPNSDLTMFWKDLGGFIKDIDFKAMGLFLILFITMFKIKGHPILYIMIGGVLGVILF